MEKDELSSDFESKEKVSLGITTKESWTGHVLDVGKKWEYPEWAATVRDVSGGALFSGSTWLKCAPSSVTDNNLLIVGKIPVLPTLQFL